MNFVLYNQEKIYPSKVVCIGRNYLEHIKELNNQIPEEMVFFIKPNSSISTELILPKNNLCHYEAEISFLIKSNKIVAVGFGLDLTLREIQSKLKAKGLPWERAKAFDSSAVFSHFVSLNYSNENLQIQLYINNTLTQSSDISYMINKPQDILTEAQSFLSFEDGDILMTGTPSGVGVVKSGDIFKGIIKLNEKIVVEKQWHAK